MRRRRNKATLASGGSLLLDTLCNTMGSVIFIAILMLIIVQKTPMGTLEVPPVSEEQMAFLRATPSTTESSLQLSSLKQQIEDYEARGITPVPTEVPLEALLAERAELSAAYKRLSHTKPDKKEEPAVRTETEETEVETEEPASPAFAFPAVESSTRQLSSLLVFKDGRYYFSKIPKSPKLDRGTKIFQTEDYHETEFRLAERGTIEVRPQARVSQDRGKEELSELLRNHESHSGRISVYVTPSGLHKFLEVAPALYAAPPEISLSAHSDDYGVALYPGPSPSSSPGF